MRTKKQVLAEFYRLQDILSESVEGFVSVNTYYMGEFWDISLRVTEYVGNIIAKQESVAWVHFSEHCDELEADNEEDLKNFKLKFNLK